MVCGRCRQMQAPGDFPLRLVRLFGSPSRRQVWMCSGCAKVEYRRHREARAAAVLARGHDGGTVERNGVQMRLTVLPDAKGGKRR
jgi:hypothetical protein